jgi:hypothetical protein
MTKERVIRSRITIEVDPDTEREIARWAIAEGRPVSNLLRRVLSEIVDQRLAAKGARISRTIGARSTSKEGARP